MNYISLKYRRLISLVLIVVLCLVFVMHLFNRYSYFVTLPTHRVTKIIHQSWKNENVDERFRNYSKSWTDHCFKDWTYMFWTDEANLKFIEKHYSWFLPTYMNLPEPINRADVSRYFYLFHYGGIYTDLDNECLKPFEHLLDGYSLVFGAMEGQFGDTSLPEGYVQNSFMYASPRHEFWLEMIHGVIKNLITLDNGTTPEVLTGPILLSNTLRSFRLRNNDRNSSMKIYQPEIFNPFSWLNKDNSDYHCKDFNRMNYDDWQKCRESMRDRGSYVVQYHAHTWN